MNFKNANKIRTMIDKSKTIDIMRDSKVDNIPLYNITNYQKLLEFKYAKNNKYKDYIKLRLII